MVCFRAVAGASLLVASVAAAACADPDVAKHEYLQRGDRYAAEQKLDEAIVEYRNAVQQDAMFGEARFKLAEALFARGAMVDAYDQYVRAADLLPADTWVQLKAATMHLAAEQFDDARRLAAGILAREPGHLDAQLVLANALAGLQDLEGAVAQIEEAIQLNPSRGASYSSLGWIRATQGAPDAARTAFERAVAIDPQSVPAWLALANFELAGGDLARGEMALQRAVGLDPTDPITNRMLAAFYIGANRLAEAEPVLRALVALMPGSAEPRLALADYYIRMNRAGEARSIVTPLRSDDDNFAEAELRLAQLEYNAGRTARAHEMLDEVLTRSPDHARVRVTKAHWLLAEGALEEAGTHVRAAMTADPEFASAHFVYGLLQKRLHNPTAAEAAFKRTLAVNPRAFAARLQLAKLHLAAGRPDSAVEYAQVALTSAPGNPDVRVVLAAGLIARQELGLAELEVAELLSEYPGVPTVHVLDGDLRLARHDLAGARQAYERAMALDPVSIDAFIGLVRADVVQGRFSQALASLRARLLTDPDRPDLLMIAARVHVTSGDLASAERMLTRLIAVEPYHRSARATLGGIYSSQGRFEEALDTLEAITSRNPGDVGTHLTMASIYERTGRPSDAKARYRRVLEINPGDPVAANNLAWMYAEAGENLNDAFRLAQQASAQYPDNPAIRDTLGWVYYRMGEPEVALAEFERSIARNPKIAGYHYHLAAAAAEAGDHGRAREAVERALQLQPDHADARRLRASLSP